jgi:glycosyltransferase involved in cell wall biosynthesis
VAAPMLVHSQQIAARIHRETGISTTALPFVPYNVPKDVEIGVTRRQAVRSRIGLDDDIMHVGTFGHVDIRTKGIDALVESMAWLVQWGRKVRLHIAGYPAAGLRETLQHMAEANGIGDVLIFHDQLDSESYKDMLLAVDVAVQLRTSPLANLSGALMDCIAHGVATVVTRAMKDEISAPEYVFALPDKFSPLLIAEMILDADGWRRESLDRVDGLRRQFLGARSMERYSASLLQLLEGRLAS